jgi:hypothetical protein
MIFLCFISSLIIIELSMICFVVQEFLTSVSLTIYFNYSGILSYLAEWTRTHPMFFHNCTVCTDLSILIPFSM